MELNGDPSHVLVVDDDDRLRELLRRFLAEAGFRVSAAGDAAEAAAALAAIRFDLVVLDVMLPDRTGVEVARDVAASGGPPILMLTARGDPEDRIRGLEAGADDYLAKPFEPRELLLRAGKLIARAGPAREEEFELRFGPYRFDGRTGELSRGDVPVRLTSGESAILDALARKADEPVSRLELAERGGVNGADRAVDVQIARLRRKIEDEEGEPRWIVTVRGAGYALRTRR